MKYRHRKSGAEVEVREGKVLDPLEWEGVEAAKPRKRAPRTADDD